MRPGDPPAIGNDRKRFGFPQAGDLSQRGGILQIDRPADRRPAAFEDAAVADPELAFPINHRPPEEDVIWRGRLDPAGESRPAPRQVRIEARGGDEFHPQRQQTVSRGGAEDPPRPEPPGRPRRRGLPAAGGLRLPLLGKCQPERRQHQWHGEEKIPGSQEPECHPRRSERPQHRHSFRGKAIHQHVHPPHREDERARRRHSDLVPAPKLGQPAGDAPRPRSHHRQRMGRPLTPVNFPRRIQQRG